MEEAATQSAVTHRIAPSPDLSKEHHGPENYHYYRKNTAYEDGKPRFFKNPWPSYRAPSLGDAYRAYSLGAAIAHPEPRKLHGLHRQKSKAKSINEGHHPLLCEDGEDAPRLIKESWYPSNTYVRPVFAEVFEDDDEEEDWRDPPVKVLAPQWDDDAQRDKEKVTWLGHAGVLIQVPWKNKEREGMCGVILDPIFSYRCSPSQYVGPARHLDPPCSVSLLPDVHVCCISHDHYDHLDYYTILDLWKYHQRTIHFLVPLGLKPWFVSCGIPDEKIDELDWYHEILIAFPPKSTINSSEPQSSLTKWDDLDLSLKFAFTPAQHRSGRGLLDHMTTLWGSWVFGVVEKENWDGREERGMRGWNGFKCFFGGDTGYRYATAPDDDQEAICPAFQEIASHYSPVSLALLPLNTGSSLPFLRTVLSVSLDQYTLTSSQHCSPSDSLEIHRIMKAERSLGIHWGTFCDKDESRGTRVEFGRGRRERGVGKRWVGEDLEERGEDGKGRFVVADIGETLIFP